MHADQSVAVDSPPQVKVCRLDDSCLRQQKQGTVELLLRLGKSRHAAERALT